MISNSKNPLKKIASFFKNSVDDNSIKVNKRLGSDLVDALQELSNINRKIVKLSNSFQPLKEQLIKAENDIETFKFSSLPEAVKLNQSIAGKIKVIDFCFDNCLAGSSTREVEKHISALVSNIQQRKKF